VTLEAEFLWGVFPYIVITVFLGGIAARYATDKYGWTSKSTELLEKRQLKWGSLLFHWGFVLVVGGHVLGLLVPVSLDQQLGVSSESYHTLAFWGGAAAGTVTIIGLGILTFRRVANPRVRSTSSVADYLTLGVLFLVMGMGLWDTLGNTLINGGYEYRTTVGVWFRSLFLFSPNVGAMAGAPATYQYHAILGMVFFLAFPFTRLVHILSLPYEYINRRFILYRSLRSTRKSSAGTSLTAERLR
jgi:nitrate reductase gamma subunit